MKKPIEAPPIQRPFSTDELAALIGFHRESVRRLIRAGRIKAIQVGRFWRVPGDEVARILAEGIPTV